MPLGTNAPRLIILGAHGRKFFVHITETRKEVRHVVSEFLWCLSRSLGSLGLLFCRLEHASFAQSSLEAQEGRS